MDFVGLASTATRLISENGRPLILRRGTAPGTDYDPVTGDIASPPVPTEFNIKAVVLAMTTSYAMKVGYAVQEGRQNITVRDKLLLMGPAVQPLMEDVITFDGFDWQVVNVEENAPNGIPLFYTVQVRP